MTLNYVLVILYEQRFCIKNHLNFNDSARLLLSVVSEGMTFESSVHKMLLAAENI